MARVHIPSDAIETTATLYELFPAGGTLTVGSTYLYGGDQDEAFSDWAYDLIERNWGVRANDIELGAPCRHCEGDDTSVVDVRSVFERKVIGYLKVKVLRRLPAVGMIDREAA